MATKITIDIGNQSFSKTFNVDNTKATNTLLKFYDYLELNPSATNAEKMDAIITWMAKSIKDGAKTMFRNESLVSINTQSETNYGLE